MVTDIPSYYRFAPALADVHRFPLADEALAVKGEYERIFGVEPKDRGGWYHPADWGRTSYVLGRLRPGAKVLDVGAGAAQFANMLAASGKFESVTAFDKYRFKKYTELDDSIQRVDGSIEHLEFEDNSFDVVTCMEVLEHIPTEIFDAGLAELRRVCGGQLMMTVPFEEPEPLSKGHVRRFVESDVVEIFPDSQMTILDRPRMPWILFEEHLDGSPFEPLDPPNVEAWRAEQLAAELARIRSRRVVHAADWLGRAARAARRRVRSLRSP